MASNEIGSQIHSAEAGSPESTRASRKISNLNAHVVQHANSSVTLSSPSKYNKVKSVLPLPEWKLEYSMTHQYNLSDISSAALEGLYEKFTAPSSGLFHKYIGYYYLSHGSSDCDSVCVQEHLCAVSEVSHSRYYYCAEQIKPESPSAHLTPGQESHKAIKYILVVLCTLGALATVAAVFLCIKRHQMATESQYTRIATLAVDWAEIGAHDGVTIPILPETTIK